MLDTMLSLPDRTGMVNCQQCSLLALQDLQNVLKLLKPSGLVVENLSNPAYAADQLTLYKEFLGGAASEEVSNLVAMASEMLR